MDEKTQELVKDKLRMVRANGGTNIVSGLENALRLLKARKNPNPITTIFFLSDGRDNNPQNVQARVADLFQIFENLHGNFTIHTFGYGRDHDHALLSYIAEMGFGKFYYIENYERVAHAFVTCLGAMQSMVSPEYELVLSLNEQTKSDLEIEFGKGTS